MFKTCPCVSSGLQVQEAEEALHKVKHRFTPLSGAGREDPSAGRVHARAAAPGSPARVQPAPSAQQSSPVTKATAQP